MKIAKILLLGDIGVGKTSIARRLAFDQFDGAYKATIGTDIYRYQVEPSPLPEPFHFVIWDTDGNFGDTIFRHVYARQADAAMIIADAGRTDTITAAASLGAGFMDAFPGRALSFVINKCDLVAAGSAPSLPLSMSSSGVPIVQTSARTGENVRAAFHGVAAVIARRS